MEKTVVEKGDAEYENLYKLWLEERKPGYVCPTSGQTYRVLSPSDDEVKFLRMGLQDDLYGSTSMKIR